MMVELRSKIPISVWILCSIWAFAGLGWFIASILFGKIAVEHSFMKIISDISLEVFKIIFIGASVGIAFDLILKKSLVKTPKEMQDLALSGIKDIYSERRKAAEEFLQLIKNENIEKVDIIGISLRDFLTGGGVMRGVWEAVWERLKFENTSSLADKNRLHVRLLLLDPKSSEGRFRHNVEKDNIGKTGLIFDVPIGIEEIKSVRRNIFAGAENNLLQIRLYEHCPFSFMFATETEVFVEQYYYRDHRRNVSLPLIKYHKNAPQYNELIDSFKTIWKKASKDLDKINYPQTAEAIDESRIINIFRRDDRLSLANRQIECINSCRPGDTINILVITGRFYLSHPTSVALKKISNIGDKSGYVKVRFALINPVSQQAIFRAVADSSPPEDIKRNLCSWTWDNHRESSLYMDVHKNIREIEYWKKRGCCFELQLFSSAVACSIMSTGESIFTEQYLYGRSEEFREGIVLGGEYPVFEYKKSENERDSKIEQEVLSSTFEVIWDSYSIMIEDYKLINEEEMFNNNMKLIREELNCKIEHKEET